VVFRDEVIELIEVALVELKGIAQPRDLAQLRELLLDAKDADDSEQLMRILEQAKGLRKFCEGRHDSGSVKK
jgi:hypothetical protein